MSETEAESDRAGAWFCPLLRLWSGQWRSGLWRVETGGGGGGGGGGEGTTAGRFLNALGVFPGLKWARRRPPRGLKIVLGDSGLLFPTSLRLGSAEWPSGRPK
jgi:hypothetical protein